MEVEFKIRQDDKLITASVQKAVNAMELSWLSGLEEVAIAVPDESPQDVLVLQPYYRRTSKNKLTLYCLVVEEYDYADYQKA